MPHTRILLRPTGHGALISGGSEIGFQIPGIGIFHGPNLTPDKARLVKDDVGAIVAFLRSAPAVKNKVPGPSGP